MCITKHPFDGANRISSAVLSLDRSLDEMQYTLLQNEVLHNNWNFIHICDDVRLV
jgi:hypothetical protein